MPENSINQPNKQKINMCSYFYYDMALLVPSMS